MDRLPLHKEFTQQTHMTHLAKHVLKYRFIVLALCVIIALALHLYKIDFPCLNSDEASFAYNAYSIAETGKDEYGSFMPSRFLAFGENKLPVTIYAMVPVIKFAGLSDITTRLPFILIGVVSPFLFYLLAKKMFKNEFVALVAAFLAGISPWIQILTRHVHEDAIMLLLTIGIMLTLSRLNHKFSLPYVGVLAVLTGLGLFTYHIGKILFVVAFCWVLVFVRKSHIPKKTSGIAVGILIIPLIFFVITELTHPTSRISNLIFTSNQGFTLEIEKLREEHDSRVIHNKLSASILTLSRQYLSYFSPEFLVIEGDANLRFGAKGISPITPIEYLLLGVGLYYLFKNKDPNRYIILSILLSAPLASSLSWQTQSLTRSFILIIPILLISSYGLYHLKSAISGKRGWGVVVLLIGSIMFFSFFSWEYYFHHYAIREDTGKAWQCGYKSLSQVVDDRKKDVDTIHISRKLGQPYIFMLYYMRFPPTAYQKQASLSPLDEYGFGQVEAFDTYIFSFMTPRVGDTKTLYVGTPDDFSGTMISRSDVDVISWQGHDVFWIYPKKTYEMKR